ncbi:MAG: hypothetical protein V1927_05420 [Candidatus Omnitrophota bacterium]
MRMIKTVNKISALAFALFMPFIFCAPARGEEPYGQYRKEFLTWLEKNSDEITGLPYSHVGDKRFEKWCITYDAAVASLAYIASGEPERAKKIIDFYRKNESVWRLGGIIGAVYAPDPGGSGESWAVWVGEDAWLAIASFHLYKATSQKEYLDLAKKIADFIASLQNENKADLNYGGVPLGPESDGMVAGDQHINYDAGMPGFSEVFATEHNIDAYALFNMLYQETKYEKYREAKDKILAWLKRVAYNKKEGRLNRGGRKEIDRAVATDVHSWGISALGVETLDGIEPGLAEKMMAFVEKNCLVKASYTKPGGEKVTVEGADYTDHNTAGTLHRGPMVSPEWTFELINAYKRLSDDFIKRGERAKADRYNQKRVKLIENMLNLAVKDSGGLAYPYATLADAPIGHGIVTPCEGNLSAIGVSYAILGLSGYDPLALTKTK